VTKDTSKVIRETDPFAAEEDADDEAPTASQSSKTPTESKRRSTGLDLGESSRSVAKKAAKDKSKKDKKGGQKKAAPFNFEAEEPKIKLYTGESSIASGELLNTLRLINREQQKISENEKAVHHFDNCKTLRRKILHYVSVQI